MSPLEHTSWRWYLKRRPRRKYKLTGIVETHSISPTVGVSYECEDKLSDFFCAKGYCLWLLPLAVHMFQIYIDPQRPTLPTQTHSHSHTHTHTTPPLTKTLLRLTLKFLFTHSRIPSWPQFYQRGVGGHRGQPSPSSLKQQGICCGFTGPTHPTLLHSLCFIGGISVSRVFLSSMRGMWKCGCIISGGGGHCSHVWLESSCVQIGGLDITSGNRSSLCAISF